MRALVVFVTTALVGLVALVPGASAQSVFTGFEASSTGLISEEGFVNLGTTFECATATSGAIVSAALEQQQAAGTSSGFAFGGHQPEGGFCAPGGAPLALGFGLSSGPPFKPGPAALSMQACVGSECRTVEQSVKLRDGGPTIEASLPPNAQSVLAFGVPSTAVLERTGVVTVGTAVNCASVSGPGFFGTLEQRHGRKIAHATATDFILGGCGGLAPLPVSYRPVADSVGFKPGHATISLTVCAGRAGDFDCGTVDGRIKLVKAK